MRSLYFIFFIASIIASAQTVVISEAEASPDGSSILDVQSSSKGMLIPRMTRNQRELISSPATGLLVYQTDATSAFYFYNGTSWIPLLDDQEEDPIFLASAAHGISNAGSGQVVTSSERALISSALQEEEDPIFGSSAANSITDAGSRRVISSGERDTIRINYDYPKVAIIRDTKGINENGGTFEEKEWITREFNTIEGDDTFLSLSSNQITLDPGEYVIDAIASALAVDAHKLRIQNLTDEVTVAIGINAFANQEPTESATGSYAAVSGIINTDKSIAVVIQHIARNVKSGNGLGAAFGGGITDSGDEVYAHVKIMKLR